MTNRLKEVSFENDVSPVQIKSGLRFTLDGDEHVVDRYNNILGCVKTTNISSGAECELQVQDILTFRSEGRLELAEDSFKAVNERNYRWEMASDAEKAQAREKESFVRAALNDEGKLLKGDDRKRAVLQQTKFLERSKAPCSRTVNRWYQLYRTQGLEGLLRKPSAKRACAANDERRLSEMQEALLREAIENVYLTTQQLTMKVVRLEMIKLSKDKEGEFYQVEVPSYTTVTRRIKSLSERLKVTKRKGLAEAIRQFNSGKRVPDPTYRMEQVEIDHTPLDIEVVDERDRTLVLGRPWLTLVLCRNTSNVAGLYLSMKTPSALEVIKALQHAMEPKIGLKERYPNVKGDWPCYGGIVSLITDPGSDLHSRQVRQFCAEAGIEVHFHMKGGSGRKGKVERAHQTVNQFVSSLAGKTSANYRENGAYKSKKEAVHTLKSVEALLVKWIVDIYHENIHRGLKFTGIESATPREAWNKSLGLGSAYLLPPSKATFDRYYFQRVERKAQRYGIALSDLHYNSPELQNFVADKGEKTPVIVQYDPRNIATVQVLKECGTPVTCYCDKQRYVEGGLDLELHERIKKRLKAEEKKVREQSDERLVEFREEFEQEESELRNAKSRAKREAQAKRDAKSRVREKGSTTKNLENGYNHYVVPRFE